jgi:hypothetical protein
MKSILAFSGALLLSATAASASVNLTVTSLGAASDGTTTYSGFTAYKVTATTTNGAKINSITLGNFNSANPGAGVFGPFLQRWTSDGLGGFTTTPAVATLNGVNANSLDSHFLTTARTTELITPTEDNNTINPAGGPADTATFDWGTGSSLTGVFGIPVANQASSIDVLYLVLPNASSATVGGQISTDENTNYTVATTVGPAAAPIPEPASLGVLALGGMALLARRRKA